MFGPNSQVTAYLGLGGNIGDPARAMAAALKVLDAAPETSVISVSSLYRTPPWGKLDQPDFLNAAAKVQTGLSAKALMRSCLAIEKALKRERAERWGPRVIDIDILVYGDSRIHEEGLEIPHPRMLERAFVLAPLAEIAPHLVIGGRPVADHASNVDVSGIEKISADGSWWSN